MEINFEIQGETPSKKNSRINTRSGRSFPNKKYRDWHVLAVGQIVYQKMKMKNVSFPIDRPIRIKMIFTHGDLRRRDSDNGASSILDTLKDSGIIADDNWQIVEELNISNEFEKNKPSCKICMEVLENEQ
jgi:Holliday junction resolvase RusA-like endonuclease